MKNVNSIIRRTQQALNTKAIAAILAACCAVFMAAAPSIAVAAEKSPVAKTAQSQQALTKVNINQADAKALASALNGVGLKKAEAIIAWREKFGKFVRIEQLTEVKGIGEKTLERNRGVIAL